jgi:hypothetical protein
MDESILSPTFRVMFGIVEKLRDTITDINDVYETATEEVQSVWKKIT